MEIIKLKRGQQFCFNNSRIKQIYVYEGMSYNLNKTSIKNAFCFYYRSLNTNKQYMSTLISSVTII